MRTRKDIYNIDDKDSRFAASKQGEEEKEEKEERVCYATAIDDNEESDSLTEASRAMTIALFGAYGKTGNHFLRLALDAGYLVRALILAGGPTGCLTEFVHQPTFHGITGTLEEEDKIQRILRGADYVVVMLNDSLPGKKDYPAGCLTSFVRLLYPLMKQEPSIQVFLFQSTSLAADVRGCTPIFSKVLKSVAHRRNLFLQDQDAVIRYIAMQHVHLPMEVHNNQEENGDDDDEDKENAPAKFSFIVTRPTVLLKDGPSTKKLSASKSQPGPFPVSHVDLAEFSLNALLKEKLLNTCPYVVADGF